VRFETFHLLSTPEMESGHDVYRFAIDQIRLADDAGFETAWFAEHHFSNYGFCPNPFLPIVKAAALTERIRFGQAVAVVPLWHPIRLVEDINVCDLLCDGRLSVGFGRGYQPSEFRAMGVDLADSQSRFDEALDVIMAAWTQRDFTFSGRHFEVPRPLTVLPEPFQRPHPPLFLAASSPNTFVRAAREGFGVLSSGASLTMAAVVEAYGRYADALRGCGVDPATREFHSLRFVHVAETDEAAARHVASSRWQGRVAAALHRGDDHVVAGRAGAVRAEGEPDDDEWGRRLVFGSPDTVTRSLRTLEAAGVSHVICHFDFGTLTQAEVLRSMELFSERVAPGFPAG